MKKLFVKALLVAGVTSALSAQTYTISTVAGSAVGVQGDGSSASLAQLFAPVATVSDAAGNVYISDMSNSNGSIRKISGATGVISTLTTAITDIRGIAIDSAGTFLYVADNGGHRIRKVDTTTGANTTVAGNGTAGFSGDGRLATAARIRNPRAVALDAAGNIYFADTINNRVRKVTASTGIITTIAGRGPSNFTPSTTDARSVTGATFSPTGLTTANQIINGVSYPAGVSLNLAASTNNAGDGGRATLAALAAPEGVAVDAAGNVYISDQFFNRVRKVDTTGIISTVAGVGTSTVPTAGGVGDGTAGPAAALNGPKGIAVGADGNLYIADAGNNRVRQLNLTTGIIRTVAGTGTAGAGAENVQPQVSALSGPSSVAFDSGGNTLISDQVNGKVRRIDAASGLITTIAGVAAGRGDNGPAVLASLNTPRGLAVGADGAVYIGDTGSNKVRRVDPVSGVLTTFLGTGAAANGVNTSNIASLTPISLPGCVAVTSSNTVTVADRGNNKIRQVDPTGNSTTIANSGGGLGYTGDGTFANGAAVFSNGGGNGPAVTNTQGVNCVAVDNLGTVYVADTSNNVIRQITNGVITTVVGYIVPSVNAAGVLVNTGVSGYIGDGGSPATQAQLAGPQGIGLSADGTQLCIADTGNHVVRQADLGKNTITTIAGIPNDGSVDANLPIAGWQSRLNGPSGCAFDASGNVFIADTTNNRVVRVDGKTGIMSLAAGGGTLVVSDGKPATQARVLLPVGVATDAAGNIYFTDRSGLVRKLTAAAAVTP